MWPQTCAHVGWRNRIKSIWPRKKNPASAGLFAEESSSQRIVSLHRIHVRHDIQYMMLLHHPLACKCGDGVAFGDCLIAVEFEMHVDDRHVTHLACAQVVQAEDTGCCQQR